MRVPISFLPFSRLMICLLASTPANPAWQRHVVSGKGDSFDTPAPHSLAYFTKDPFLRDDGMDFCDDCTPKGKATVHTRHKFKTELRKVGDLQGFAIYDLFYYFDDHIATGQIDWKSILVQSSAGAYREIYHLQPTNALISPSFFVRAGPDEILVTYDLIPGTGSQIYEDYFWFGPDGPVRINTGPISEALKSILPEGLGVWKGGGLDMKSLKYHMPVWKEGDANCCPTGGMVDISFRLEAGRLLITRKHFDPLAKPE
jgi:hypothetical protein